jgi:4'-phosphopantetheinyl transferase EntD
MIDSDMVEAWQKLLPPCVKVSAGPLLEKTVPLTPVERASAGMVDDVRTAELEAGRVYAKRALEMMGIENVDLPVGPDRAPRWPVGVVGSLTHVRGRGGSHIAAAVGWARDIRGIGIDVEYTTTAPAPKVWKSILTKRELEHIRALPADRRGPEVLNRWCTKEAATKALQRAINPASIETEYDPETGEYLASHTSFGESKFNKGLRGGIRRLHGFVLAAVVLNEWP